MVLISHRGNINGRFESKENNPTYIDDAISKDFEVEVDVWYQDNILLLGHDKPEYIVDLSWFTARMSKLWVHCKNIEALLYFKESNYPINYFWHQNDDVTITSLGYFWTYPGKKLTNISIACMPEIASFDNLETAIGICSDFIESYKKI